MDRTKIDSILAKMEKPAAQMAKVEAVRAAVPKPRKQLHIDDLEDDDEGEQDEYIPVGINGLLHASEKLLAVNRGLDKPDERDSLIFKRFMTTDRLLAERISMDSDRVRGKVMPAIAKQRSLRSLHPFMFDHYMEGFLLGNPLSTPLEEINPLHLVEQSRRVTQMGPGGIGSDNAVTEDMQAISGSQFGFISGLEGPECLSKNTEVFTSDGWILFSEAVNETLFACDIGGVIEYHKASKLVTYTYNGDLICARNKSICMELTPTHRVYHAKNTVDIWNTYSVDAAVDIFGKHIRIPGWDSNRTGKYHAVRTKHWSKEPYDDIVYCATVPGSKLLVRGSSDTQGFWTGNSEKAGIDARLSWGTRIGSDGKIYQQFKDRATGKMKWMSPSDLDGKVLGLPQ